MTGTSRSLLHATVLGFVLYMLMPQRAQGVEPTVQRAHLQGTFLQLVNENREWTTDKWAELFSNFKQLHLSHLVVQWTVNDRLAFYRARNGATVANPPLETILRMADEAGIQVSVGLVYDPGFWKASGGTPTEVDVYLNGILARSAAVAEELAPRVRTHPCFKGWYIVEEIDDGSWSTPEAQHILFSYLRGLSSFLHALTPAAQVAVSGFSSERTDPKSLGTFWSALLREAPGIDLVLFQDGIGAGKLDLTKLPLYLSAMRDATNANARELKTVIEIFKQTGGPTVDGGPFRAVPASLERILDQLTVVAPYSINAVAFSVPEYMSSLGGTAASELYEAYLAELRRASKTWLSRVVRWNGR